MPSVLTPDLKETWKAYKHRGGVALRNRLMESYLPIVRYNAERIRAKLPDEVDKDDLISAGVFGLFDAIEAFDLERGVKFETYCAPRVRGAILDELRSMDWVPRLVRTRATKLARANEALEAELGRRPNEVELSERLAITREELVKVRRETATSTLISLSRKCFETDSSRDVREIGVLEDRRSEDALGEIQRRDLKDVLTRGMTRAERVILIRYYDELMTMKEIGSVLDLSESRVSQMHSAILQRLKTQLAGRHKDLTR